MKRTWNRGGAHLGYKSFSGAALSMDQHAFSRPGGSPDRPYRRVVVLEVPPSRRRRPRRNTPPSASWRSPSRQATPPPPVPFALPLGLASAGSSRVQKQNEVVFGGCKKTQNNASHRMATTRFPKNSVCYVSETYKRRQKSQKLSTREINNEQNGVRRFQGRP